MRVLALKNFPGVVMHVSDDVYNAHQVSLEEETFGVTMEESLEMDFERMFQDRIDDVFFQYVKAYGNKRGSSGIIVLNVNGCTHNGKWAYVDDAFWENVQAWIDRHDTTCAALVLMVGNEDGHSVTSKSALVFVPDAMVGAGIEFDLRLREFHFTLCLPGGEEIDSNTIDWHLANV